VWLAHFASTPLPSLMDMDADELVEWHQAAVTQWNKMHPKEG
jgi:hypothetical protein